ncbi:hypothetical protein K435DRAFT_779364 [Dendrothele bispora CBS 962.96]|uniref:Uncharacterized protein n=1 Tax=Dendrothele bispora (strain CBS 962.96) TaxID=1314807 RepID=A0A4S8LYD0_DENBC|nr:hypothetical protein K435DRAFT_779364 [Dendrothele bispora CBS 962.96]
MDQLNQSNRLSALSLIWNTTSISAGDISIPRMKAGLAQIGGKRDSSGLPMAESHRESGGVSNGQTMIVFSQNQTCELEDMDHKNRKNQ